MIENKDVALLSQLPQLPDGFAIVETFDAEFQWLAKGLPPLNSKANAEPLNPKASEPVKSFRPTKNPEELLSFRKMDQVASPKVPVKAWVNALDKKEFSATATKNKALLHSALKTFSPDELEDVFANCSRQGRTLLLSLLAK